MDWSSRAVLSWRLSNSLDVAFCVSALEAALARFGKPEIFNTDQGSQFTSAAFTGVLASAGTGSQWTTAAAGWTTSSSSACGGHSSTKTFT
jgi:transposase InsO family protein